MSIKLRGREDYYAEVYEIEDTKFWLADLDDDQFGVLLEKTRTLAQKLGLPELLPGADFDPAEAMGKMMKLAVDADLQGEARKQMAGLIHWLLDVGLLKWNISDAEGSIECDADTKKALPSAVKSALAQKIVAISQLTLGEANFPFGPQPGPAEGRGPS